jgi:NAD(P)-dependent dehydrogenase (short-subunit alcohol dehydrogenase family)
VKSFCRGAKVYIACRSLERGELARAEIVERTGNANVFVRQLDLASFDSIREFAER